jgi:uncharacterized protein (DUF1499 family)
MLIERGDPMTHPIRPAGYTPSPALSRTAAAGFLLSVTAAGIAISAGLGSRWDLWHYTRSLLLLKVAAMGGILSFAVSLAGAVITRPGTWRGGFRRSVFGLAISFFVVSVPLSWCAVTHKAPPIHDITTDAGDPPQFKALLPLRVKASNSLDYDGPDVASLQQAAYPDVKPITLFTSPDQAIDRALAAARSLGWTILQRDRQEGRIEATDRTLWFGFTDDIVIRVRPENDGSRIDIRSVSRVGAGDMGTNADRIRKFTKKLAEAVEPPAGAGGSTYVSTGTR